MSWKSPKCPFTGEPTYTTPPWEGRKPTVRELLEAAAFCLHDMQNHMEMGVGADQMATTRWHKTQEAIEAHFGKQCAAAIYKDQGRPTPLHGHR